MRWRAFGGGVITAVAGLLAVLLASVFLCASSANLYTWAMNRAGVYESAGVDRQTLNAVAGDVAHYLRERVPSVTFDRVIVMDGQERLELNERELSHMQDVRRLINSIASALGLCLLVCVPIAIITFRMKARRAVGWGLICGAGVLVLGAATVFVAIQIDFYSFFVALHERLFTNDLWYMNPETDLLIRMMPSGFFLSLGAVIGAVWLAAVLVTCGLGLALVLSNRRRKAPDAV